jgi:tetratricopeptide (TPR) repeat protein
LEALGDLLSRGNEPELDRAILALDESLKIGREQSDRRHQAIVLSRLAKLAERQGRRSDAIEMLGDVVKLNRARRDRFHAAEAQRHLDRLKDEGMGKPSSGLEF